MRVSTRDAGLPPRSPIRGGSHIKRWFAVLTLAALILGPAAPSAEAARVRVVHRGPRARVTIRTGFPIRRTLPTVVVRAPRITVRVTPRIFLPAVVFGATVAAIAATESRVWHEEETLSRADGWTDFSLNVDARGTRLLLDITGGSAQISFAEVVFENGEAQVVDFNERTHKLGTYGLLDFKDGRKVDHVRIVAKASGASTTIGLHLL